MQRFFHQVSTLLLYNLLMADRFSLNHGTRMFIKCKRYKQDMECSCIHSKNEKFYNYPMFRSTFKRVISHRMEVDN